MLARWVAKSSLFAPPSSPSPSLSPSPRQRAQAQAQAQARRRSPHLFITQVCRAADLASQLARAPPGGRGGFARYFQRRTAARPDKNSEVRVRYRAADRLCQGT